MTTPVPLRSRLAARLGDLADQQLLRTLRAPEGRDLSSNDYLGLAADARLTRRMAEAVVREGCGSTGSRLLRGHREAFGVVERAFAAFKGTERALYFSSGYLANLAVMTTFAEPGDVVLSDRLNHASLRDGIRLSHARRAVFAHGNACALEELLASTRGPGQTFVVTESLFSMDGDVPPLADYASLCRAAGALLVVDEAHAVGLYGARGSGLIEERGIERDVFVSINTAGKALGVAGAFVAGPAWAIDYLEQRARPFVFSTAPPPAVAAAIEESLAIVREAPERRHRVRALAAHLRTALEAHGVTVRHDDSPIVPIVLGSADRALKVASAIQARGFDVRAIRPPTVPPGTARLRVSVNASLTEAVVDEFVRTLAAVLQDVPSCLAASS